MNIRILRFIIGFIALVNVNNIYAVEYTLQDDELLKLEISDSGPTRINLKDEKINDILMYPQNTVEVIVHESGCLFIAPREEGNKVYLTVIGEYKTIQDLMLTFTPKTPNPVMLVNAATKIEEKDNSKQNNNNLFSNDLNTKELTAKPSKKQSRNTKEK
ncbi:hypothetical protein [Orientia tsutsugamushi]|uniref:Uncharacterized protein n=1 Tax=Orientia tsutsugamushi TaxID=784 RepID=A0A2U3RJV9_ORITS|nr:hypothetical protein [Orientia tsutsugamushi]KJV52575.1 hypothetical protein OTSKATO_1353 [Orientia tsutsugamushi str. Kato PP]SPR04861.1 Uncharacterised protein [Orientia tsutsugamushi]SPR05622.1 Uncharacterised protein [Orientia tsutsugamushi]SPR08299.1 Uncharacterised protein [Orientia tsutsugamushi]SPR10442.1 Uncharacterised protein [Orientia tsutsugamushi]